MFASIIKTNKMKKLVLIGLFVLGFSAVAQEKGNVEFGVTVGYSSANVTTGYFQSETSSGFNAGVSAEYYFSDRWGIKGRILYDQKGWDKGYFIDENDNSFPADYSLNYITVPVMANWHFGRKRNWYLNFGPYIGFLANATESSADTDVKEGFCSTDFGLSYGIGVKIPVSNKMKLSLEFDGQEGFSDVFKVNQNSAVRNYRGSFNVGLLFLMK